MKKLTILTIVGTRPELIRLSRILNKLDFYFNHLLAHTGQNYDYELNQIFFENLEIRKPDIFFNAAAETPGETIGNILIETEKFLLNNKSFEFKKKLVVGAISKYDGHIFVFNFKNKKSACLNCFYQEKPSDDILNCDQEGILGSTASIVGSFQANEVIKIIIGSKNILTNSILILNTLNLKQRIVKFKKLKKCICGT